MLEPRKECVGSSTNNFFLGRCCQGKFVCKMAQHHYLVDACRHNGADFVLVQADFCIEGVLGAVKLARPEL